MSGSGYFVSEMDSTASSPVPPGRPRLRLVGSEPEPEQTRLRAVTPREVAARKAIAQENHAAKRTAQALPEGDLRLVFAIDVAKALQGGRAAILTPERRRDLVAGAESMGMRPFDANLVIAMVQHAAREGEDAAGPGAMGALPLIRGGERRAGRKAGVSFGVLFGITGVVAAALFYGLRWLFTS